MKNKIFISFAVLVSFALGCGTSSTIGQKSSILPVVSAQISGVTFTNCQTTNLPTSDSICSQYLVQVNSRRGIPKFQVFQVQSQPVLLDGTFIGSQFVPIGSGTSFTQQLPELATGTSTFTLSAVEP